METKQISAWLRILSIASLVYLLTCIPVYLAAKNFVHVVMIWNLFLAALPLLFAWLVRREVLSGRIDAYCQNPYRNAVFVYGVFLKCCDVQTTAIFGTHSEFHFPMMV